MTLIRHLGPGAAAGLAAGTLTGLVETLSLFLMTGDPQNLRVWTYATISYGLLCLSLGLGLALLLWLIGLSPKLAHRWPIDQGFLLYLALLFSPLVVVIVRYRLIRDLFQEKLPTFSAQGGLVHVLLLLAGGLIFGLILWGGRRLAGKAGSGLSLTVVILLVSVVLPFALSPRATTGPVNVEKANPAKLNQPPNIILILVDTLRADRLSAYGYSRPSPGIDGLAADGVLYKNMIAQASWTKPSVATIFTGLYPSSHQAVFKQDRLPEAVTTLPEVLRRHGYTTAGYSNNANVTATFNFDQGFSEFEYLAPAYLFFASERSSQLAIYNLIRLVYQRFLNRQTLVEHFYQPAPVVNQRAITWLAGHKQERFFLFLHYMEPHDPYMVHPMNGVGYARVAQPNPSAEVAPLYSALYDGEIAYLDQHLTELFAWLKAEALYDQTMIILTSDHGEEFYEHQGWWHGTTLYEEQIHVPLIIKYPAGLAQTGLVDEYLTRSLDIAPTVLDVAGIAIPAAMQGLSVIDQATVRPDQVFSEEDFEGNILQSMRGLNWKYIQANPHNPRGLPPAALFQLETDPHEQENLVDAEPSQVNNLRTNLETTLRRALNEAIAKDQTELDETTEERLRNLGY
jgi:arylsulfatase A-like enzyme